LQKILAASDEWQEGSDMENDNNGKGSSAISGLAQGYRDDAMTITS
jgi:hypothetical protein